MIDSETTGNFILLNLIKKFKIFKQRKASPIEFIIINEILIFQNNGLIKFETLLINMKIHKYRKKIQFDIIDIAEHNIILRIL